MSEKEQRIIDKPTLEQVKALLAKNKDISQEKKESPAASPDKTDLLLEKIEGLIKRQDRLEQVYNQTVVLPTGSSSSEKKAAGQEKKSNQELLAEAEAEQERLAHQGQPGQPGQEQAQLSPEQYQALPAEKKVPLLEAQIKAQEGQQNVGKLTGQQALYGLIETIKAAVPAIQTAIANKGGNNDNPLKQFLDQIQTYESIEQGALGRFFNYMKMLSPGQREAKMDNIDKSAPGDVGVPKTDKGRIVE